MFFEYESDKVYHINLNQLSHVTVEKSSGNFVTFYFVSPQAGAKYETAHLSDVKLSELQQLLAKR